MQRCECVNYGNNAVRRPCHTIRERQHTSNGQNDSTSFERYDPCANLKINYKGDNLGTSLWIWKKKSIQILKDWDDKTIVISINWLNHLFE